ncbi:hypothetical protein PAI11_03010 [Patulibacter medicamentivorans]|uniref:Uncharacterized protein n=1 Tax=Patulibacter medicamentivorans TaxID=1097667 RepID=H0E0J3_9ACTN|nr:hypothetical protein [Patulibacter medicamentivorans]EHN12812.1 hypothetical protein PAI11_03010 [Patulibacter medicamentivorans]
MSDKTQPRDPSSEDAPADAESGAQLSGLAKLLAQGVVVTGERVQEAIEDAVRRGRMTRNDAHELAATIVAAGRRQTEELRSELEQLLGRGRGRIIGQRPGGGDGEDEPRAAVPALPIAGYDEMTAAEVIQALDGLSAAELRRVGDHEGRTANRKTVLRAIERKLG